MAVEIRLPPLGQTSDEMIIAEWYRKPGDSIEEGEPLLSVETDKVTVDVEAAAGGTLLAVLAEPGETVEAGALIAWIGEAGEQVPSAAAQSAPAPAAASTSPAGSAVATELSPPVAATSSPTAAPAVPQALPAVRQLARENGVDIATLRGSGPGGRIERADVIAAVAARDGGSAPAPAAPGVEPVPPARAAMARRLVESVQRIPQFTVSVQCDVAAARALCAELRERGVRLGLTHVVTRALAATLREHAQFNRVWSDDGPSYRILDGATVGVAVATDAALLVVSVPDADRLDWPELVAAVDGAVSRARSRGLTAADQRPAAITLSNLGMHDVDAFRAIVDRDQTAIAAMGSVRAVPAVRDGQLVVSDSVVINLTSDHRVVDGVDAARFAATLRGLVEDPARLASPSGVA